MFISKKKFNAKINQAFIKGIYYGKMFENQENFIKNNSPNNIRERYTLRGKTMNKKDMCEMYEEMQAENYGYRKGVEEEKNKRTEQLEYIRIKIERLIEICPETVVSMPLMDLFNEIGLMKKDIWRKPQ